MLFFFTKAFVSCLPSRQYSLHKRAAPQTKVYQFERREDNVKMNAIVSRRHYDNGLIEISACNQFRNIFILLHVFHGDRDMLIDIGPPAPLPHQGPVNAQPIFKISCFFFPQKCLKYLSALQKS